jgi:branched-chain amino acid transport system ATP-binding protein
LSGPLLQVEDLEAAYGAVQVVWGVSLRVAEGQVVGMIGPNGAGKTTTLNVLAGLLPAKKGKVILRGEDITGDPPHERAKHQISLIPEERQLWPRMTVEENLLMGAFPTNLRRKAAENLNRVYQMFPRLKERRAQLAGTLSGGEQQMCAIGRGLMADPLLLMLDEPSLGLAPMLVEEIFRFVREIAAQGATILLAGQNANYTLQVSDYCYVMETGRIAMAGPSAALRANDHVQRAYLGAAEENGKR